MKPFNENDFLDFMWEKMSWQEINKCAREKTIILLPLGSIEQHGPMLPVECDYFLAKTRCLAGAQKALTDFKIKSLVLPTIPYGVSTEHNDYPGTISLNLQTYILLVQDIITEVVRADFKKIILVSGHGGNIIPAMACIRDLKDSFKKQRIKGTNIFFADDTNCFTDISKIYKEMKQDQFNFHADAVETSFYLFNKPDLIKKEGMVKPKVKVKQMPMGSWYTKDITVSGASGNPLRANAEYGEKLFSYATKALALFIKNCSAYRN